MSFAESFKKVIGIEDIDEDEMISEEEVNEAKEKISMNTRTVENSSTSYEKRTPVATPKPSKTPAPTKAPEKRFSVANTGAFKLVLIEPKSFDECPKLVDNLQAKKPVIINLEKLETEIARKIFDFMSGATYALHGNVQKVANNIFVFAPANVDIASTQEQKGNATFADPDRSPWR